MRRCRQAAGSPKREERLETGETAAEKLIVQFYGRGPPGLVLSCLACPPTSRSAPMLFLFDDESRLSLLEMRLVLFKLFSRRRRRRQQQHRRAAGISLPRPRPQPLPLDLSIYVVSRQAGAGRGLSVRFSTFWPSSPSFPHILRPTSDVAEVERSEARTREEFRS